jgi:signal transduction histidine kinase
MAMSVSEKTYPKFHLRLFGSVIFVILLISLCFIVFQYIREKQYKIDLLNCKLMGYNDFIDLEMRRGLPIEDFYLEDLSRFSLIDFSGKILYDSEFPDINLFETSCRHKEIKQAMAKGIGYDIRQSAIVESVYFFSAKKYDNYIIRSAIPYDSVLASSLKVDPLFLTVTFLILIIFIIVFYKVTSLLGQNINRLKDFATKAEHEDMDEYPVHFPNDELGDISRHIVQIYTRLQKTKQALIVEQERVLKQKEEQESLKKQLTQNISHELKTPVSSIRGYLETIINVKDLPEEIRNSFIIKCYKQSTRLSSLLHDILTLNRMDEAPEFITKEKIDLAELISIVLYDVSLLLHKKKIKVYNRTERLMLVCNGNHSLLYSVFRNLIDNTVAYAGDGVSIYIECDTGDPDYYHFSFSDDGIGIAEEHLENVFNRFYRVDRGRSRKAGGTGLGLSIVKNALLIHGGAINVRQRSGGGVEFVFSIER